MTPKGVIRSKDISLITIRLSEQFGTEAMSIVTHLMGQIST